MIRLPPLKTRAKMGTISLWCNIVAVLSGALTRTGPWGVGTPCGLPQFMFPFIFYRIAFIKARLFNGFFTCENSFRRCTIRNPEQEKSPYRAKNSGADFRCVFLLSLGERVLLTLISVWMGQGGQSIVAIANANPSACRNHHLAEALVVCALVIRIVFSCMGQCVLLSGMVGYDKAHTAHKPEVAQGSRSCIG